MQLNIALQVFFYIVVILIFHIFMHTVRKRRLQIMLLDLFDLVSFLVFVMWVVLFIRFFIFNPFTVVGQSMETKFHQWDFIIVDKITPRLWTLERGDIVVFVPKNRDVPFIKRIVWLPGETVKIVNNNVMICTGTGADQECDKLEEYYLWKDVVTSTTQCNVDTFEVQDDGYFVMWDNRSASTDSRCCFGLWCFENSNYLVYPEDIIWKVAIKLFPTLEGHW